MPQLAGCSVCVCKDYYSLLFPAAKPKSGDTKSSSVKEKKAGQEDGKGSKGEGPPPESMQPLPRPLVALEPPKDNEATKRPRSVYSVVSCDIAVLGICSVYLHTALKLITTRTKGWAKITPIQSLSTPLGAPARMFPSRTRSYPQLS